MKHTGLLVVFLVAALVAPTGAFARTDCTTSDATQAVAGITVGVTAGGPGTTGQGTAVGACLDGLSSVTPGFDGGLVEAGTAAGGVYAVVDGDDANTAITEITGDYIGVSNVETSSAREPCDPATNTGSGSNSGGCLVLRSVLAIPVPLLICGDASGKSWENSSRDGCWLPPM